MSDDDANCCCDPDCTCPYCSSGSCFADRVFGLTWNGTGYTTAYDGTQESVAEGINFRLPTAAFQCTYANRTVMVCLLASGFADSDGTWNVAALFYVNGGGDMVMLIAADLIVSASVVASYVSSETVLNAGVPTFNCSTLAKSGTVFKCHGTGPASIPWAVAA